MGDTRIPPKIADFNTYVNNTDDYLLAIPDGATVTNRERLGISTTVGTEWHNRRIDWRDTLYPAYSNLNTRTTVITGNVQNFMTNFKTFANPQLNIIAASPAGVHDDEVAFNLVLLANRADPTHRTTPITEQCFVTITPLGGAEYRITFRTSTDDNRASILEGADSVLAAIQIGGTPPESADDLTETFILTKAIDVHYFGTDNIGSKIYFFARWYYTRKPELAGPWSTMYTILVA